MTNFKYLGLLVLRNREISILRMMIILTVIEPPSTKQQLALLIGKITYLVLGLTIVIKILYSTP